MVMVISRMNALEITLKNCHLLHLLIKTILLPLRDLLQQTPLPECFNYFCCYKEI